MEDESLVDAAAQAAKSSSDVALQFVESTIEQLLYLLRRLDESATAAAAAYTQNDGQRDAAAAAAAVADAKAEFLQQGPRCLYRLRRNVRRIFSQADEALAEVEVAAQEALDAREKLGVVKSRCALLAGEAKRLRIAAPLVEKLVPHLYYSRREEDDPLTSSNLPPESINNREVEQPKTLSELLAAAPADKLPYEFVLDTLKADLARRESEEKQLTTLQKTIEKSESQLAAVRQRQAEVEKRAVAIVADMEALHVVATATVAATAAATTTAATASAKTPQ